MDHIHQWTRLIYVDDDRRRPAKLACVRYLFPVAAFPESPKLRSRSTGDPRNRRLRT